MVGNRKNQRRGLFIASNDDLSRKSFELGLEKYIQGNLAQRGVISNHTMATTLEAMIGAFFNSGFDYAVSSNVMARWVLDGVDRHSMCHSDRIADVSPASLANMKDTQMSFLHISSCRKGLLVILACIGARFLIEVNRDFAERPGTYLHE